MLIHDGNITEIPAKISSWPKIWRYLNKFCYLSQVSLWGYLQSP